MQCDALHSPNSTAHPLEVQVPSLAGISIPPMKGETALVLVVTAVLSAFYLFIAFLLGLTGS